MDYLLSLLNTFILYIFSLVFIFTFSLHIRTILIEVFADDHDAMLWKREAEPFTSEYRVLYSYMKLFVYQITFEEKLRSVHIIYNSYYVFNASATILFQTVGFMISNKLVHKIVVGQNNLENTECLYIE